MYGAIIGDLAGSIYEYSEFIDSQNNIVNKNRRLEILTKKNLISEDSFYSDDTILTMAVLDSILSGDSYQEKLKEYGLKYGLDKLNKENYFEYMFSPGFISWCKGLKEGTSIGNGCMMRISPIPYLFDELNIIKKQNRLCTSTSHNNDSSIRASEIVCVVIYLARLGKTKEFIKKYLEKEYNVNLNYDIEFLRENYLFDSTNNVLEICLYILFYSNDFDEAIRNAVSIGGDTDTIACIVGSMAEALYGVDESLINDVNKKIPDDFKKMLKLGYKKINRI